MSASTPERILQRLDWQVIRRLDGLLQGDYRSLFYGYGVDFADLREYQPEDDIRYIDWNVTARMDTPYVRQYVEDREITAWFLLDLSPSMDFGTVGRPHPPLPPPRRRGAEPQRQSSLTASAARGGTESQRGGIEGAQTLKRTVLVDFVGTFARLLTRHGNRVGAIFYGGTPPSPPATGGNRGGLIMDRTIPPGGGRLQVLRLVNDLLKQPRLSRVPATNLTPMLQAGLHTIRRRSLIFIISDFISEPGWERPLRLLNQRHEVLAVRLWDPREVELPDIGLVVMEDAETGEQLYVDTSDRKFRQRFQEAAQRREATLKENFKRAGVDVLSLSTDEDLVRAIVRLVMLRRQRRRQR